MKTYPFLWMLELYSLILVLTRFFSEINFRRGGAGNWGIRPDMSENIGKNWKYQHTMYINVTMKYNN